MLEGWNNFAMDIVLNQKKLDLATIWETCKDVGVCQFTNYEVVELIA